MKEKTKNMTRYFKLGLFVLLFVASFMINTTRVEAAGRKLSMKNLYTTQYKLNSKQKDFWNKTMKEYKSGKRGVVDIDTKMTRAEVEKLVYNPSLLPNLYYTDTTVLPCTFGIKTDGSGIIMHMKMDELDKAIKTSTFNQKKIKKIIKKLKLTKKTTQTDAVKKINSYLVKNISYDYSCTKYTLSDALKGKSVCNGYARAFCAIAKTVGLNAQYVAGTGYTSTNSGFHAWNKVKIGGSWKYLDVCWNDTSKTVTKYLLNTKKQISKNHKEKPSDNKNIIYKYI